MFLAAKGATVLTETQELDSINYRPKTRQSRIAYEEVLSTMAGALGDQPQDVLRGAADEVLAILKVSFVLFFVSASSYDRACPIRCNVRSHKSFVSRGAVFYFVFVLLPNTTAVLVKVLHKGRRQFDNVLSFLVLTAVQIPY